MDTKLILIDGLTGAGKSTTAQRLWLHLQRCGHAAEWFSEEDTAHPLWHPGERFESGALDRSFLDDTMVARWRRFVAERAATGAVAVLESALTMAAFLPAMHVPMQAITEHLRTVERLTARLKPVLIYLRQRDATQSLKSVCEGRGSDEFDYASRLIERAGRTPYGQADGVKDFSGLVRFYDRWRDAIERLFARTSIYKLAIEVSSGDWRFCERQLTEFVGLPQIDEAAVRIDRPSRFVGRYRDVDSASEIVVAANEQGLYIDGVHPTRLFPKEGSAFYVAATCAELSFGDQSEGCFHRIDIRGNLADLSPVWTRVEAGP